jgi:hypothetical protein
VWKTTRPRRPSRVESIDPNEIRTDLYQRDVDLPKVLGMRATLARGETLPIPKVSRREDGTTWVTDGQHRIEAHKLYHGPGVPIDCLVEYGLTWGEEHDRCREAIAKILDPLAGVDELLADELVAKAVFDLPPVRVSYQDATSSQPTLDPLIWEGLRLRPEIRERIETAWSRVAGPDWASYSSLYLPTGTATVEAVIDWPALRAAHPDWAHLADTDLHMALVVLARQRLADADLVPGRQLQLIIRPEHTPAEFVAAVEEISDGGPVWSLGGQQWIHAVPDAIAEPVEKVWPDYAFHD